MNWRYTLAEPELGEEEIGAVSAVLRSKWLTMGAVAKEFERRFAEKLGVKHAFVVNNCTAALHLANLTVGVRPGDEVICPDLTFVASANATRYVGGDVVFADVVSADDLTIDPEDIRRKITARTRAITVVHYGGFPCRMDAIMALAAEHGLKVIEDCAHAPFAFYDFDDGTRRSLGTIGDVGCFSFFGNKNMTTGEGGMLTTNDDAIADQVRLLRSHGMTTLTYERHKGHASGYDVVALGYNYRMDELHAAIGLCQLDKVDRLNQRRREMYQAYLDAFEGVEGVRVPFRDRPLDQSVCHIMPLMVGPRYEAVRAHLHECRIQTSKHYSPISSFSAWGNRSEETIDGYQVLTLPLSPSMSREDVFEIAAAVREVL